MTIFQHKRNVIQSIMQGKILCNQYSPERIVEKLHYILGNIISIQEIKSVTQLAK